MVWSVVVGSCVVVAAPGTVIVTVTVDVSVGGPVTGLVNPPVLFEFGLIVRAVLASNAADGAAHEDDADCADEDADDE